MAILRGYVPLTLDGSGTGSGSELDPVVVEATREVYAISDGVVLDVYEGLFSYNSAGEPRGLLEAITLIDQYGVFLEITGLRREISTFFGLSGSPDTGDLAYLLLGADVIVGSRFDDILRGFDENDRLTGGAGNDMLFGDAGNDRLIGGQGQDKLDGGTGADLMQGGEGSDATSSTPPRTG